MTVVELARVAKQCRDAQRAYFRTRGQAELQVSKDWERRLDAAVEAILNPPPPDLFGGGDPLRYGGE